MAAAAQIVSPYAPRPVFVPLHDRIERWAVAGQSFGGRLALRYAAAYPGHTSAVIFENPVWDVAASARAALPPIAAMLAERGNTKAAQAALAAAGGEQAVGPLREAYLVALRALGEDRESFFVPSAETRARLVEVRRAHERNFPFPYLRDESQDVARAYGAMRTPHYFLFTHEACGGGTHPTGRWLLRYTGRMDDNPRQPGMERTHELRDAVDALLCGQKPPVEVINPIGCNVKWKGKPAKWMPPEACDLV